MMRKLCYWLCVSVLVAASSVPLNAGPQKAAKELIDRRTANSKHWLSPEGTVTAEIYSGPVHYRATDGTWQDIDTTLQRSSKDGFDYSVLRSATKVHLAGTADGWQALEVGDLTLQFSAQDANATAGVVDGNTITYPDVWPSVDLRYTVLPSGVKEDIILKARPSTKTFRFLVKTAGLTPALDVDGSLLLRDSLSRGRARILAPFLVDAEAKSSRSVDARWWVTQGGVLEISLIPDGQWLDSAQYPVVLDPTTIINEEQAVSMDQYFHEYGAYWVEGTTTLLIAQYDYGEMFYATHTCIQFDTSSINSNAVVTGARVQLTPVPHTDDHGYVEMRKIIESWPPSNPHTLPLTGAQLDSRQWLWTNPCVFQSVALTDTVQEWVSTPASNFGVKFRGTSYWPLNYEAKCYASEYSDPAKQPKLFVDYDDTPPTTPVVVDGGDYTDSLTALWASWSASDPETGIAQYKYRIVDDVGAIVQDWTTVSGETTEVTATGLSLTYSHTYYFKVQACNGSGMWGLEGVSDGITAGTGLKNGDFEHGFHADSITPDSVGDYWRGFNLSGSATFVDDTIMFRSPGHCQRLEGTSWTSGIYQTVSNLQVGENHVATAWVCGSSVTSFRIGIDPYGNTSPTSSSIVWSPPVTGTGANWTQLSVYTTVFSQSATVYIKAKNPTATSGAVWIDDVAFHREAVLAWNPAHASATHRREVVLNPHTADRTNVPLFVRIPAPAGEYVDTSSVAVDEIISGSPVAVACDAWAQRSGKVAEVYFVASGTTLAGAARRFVVYYNLISSPVAYEWQPDDWGSYAEIDRNSNQVPDAFRLESDLLALERSWQESDGKLLYKRQPGYSLLERLSDSWSPVEGYLATYTATANSTRYDTINAEDLVAPTRVQSRSASQVSISLQFDDVASGSCPLHDVEETYRLIRGQPWCEFVMTVSEPLTLVDHYWDPKTLYFNTSQCGFTRMVSDVYEDQPVDCIWNTTARWLVVYKPEAGGPEQAAGWLLFKPGTLRVEAAGDPDPDVVMHNTYEYSVEDDNTYRYLWVVGEKDEIISLFRSMVPGWRVGDSETPGDVRIVSPRTGDRFFPGDSVSVQITAPGGATNIAATLDRPTLPDVPVALVETEAGYRWDGCHDIQANDDWGAWTLVVSENGVPVASTSFDVSPSPSIPHPKLLFSAADLEEELQHRCTTHEAEWGQLEDWCDNLVGDTSKPSKEPPPGTDIRNYYERLLSLALFVKLGTVGTDCAIEDITPYEDKMWEYFWTMLRYRNWYVSPMWKDNNEDLCGMHFLLALSLTYDWHYDKLNAVDRREVRERFAEYTQRALEDYWQFDEPEMDVSRCLCNHIWIVHGGLASVAYALEDEVSQTLTDDWLGRCDRAWDRVLGYLSQDGSNLEGVGYHNYGLQGLECWAEMRWMAADRIGDHPFTEHPWFARASRYNLYSVLPGGTDPLGDTDNFGGVADFGDCPVHGWYSNRSTMHIIARRLQDPIAQWVSDELEDEPLQDLKLPWRLLWRDADLQPCDVMTLPNWHLFQEPDDPYASGIFVWRSSWQGDATYFSLKCGRDATSHQHPDSGSFILHRGGVPYIVDHGYSWGKTTEEHNLLLVNYDPEADPPAQPWSYGQRGSGDLIDYSYPRSRYFKPQDPEYWGSIDHVLASGASGDPPGDFFDLVCNPQPTYTNENLTKWTREAVGLGDVLLIRDDLAATEPVTFDLLLHSYASRASGYCFEFVTDAQTNPWSGTGPWTADVRTGAPSLVVTDLSSDTDWSYSLDVFSYVPELLPGSGYNWGCLTYQVGGTLRRRCVSEGTSSLVALGFDDQIAGWTISPWSEAQAEGMRCTDAGGDVMSVLWPLAGSCSNSDGWTVTGAMAGRRYSGGNRPAYFGREVSSIVDNGTLLLQATAEGVPVRVSFHGQMEHAPVEEDPNTAEVLLPASEAAQCQLVLRCPNEPTTAVTLDGSAVNYSWNSGQLTLPEMPAGQHILRCY